MKKSLIIDSVSRDGKKLQKTMTFVNPNASNEVAGTFAQMANALTTNTYSKASIVKRMDVTETEQGGGSGLLNPYLRSDNDNRIQWEGNGVCKTSDGDVVEKDSEEYGAIYLLDSDGTYAKDWLDLT